MTLMMEAVQTSETFVNSYQATRRNNPEDGHLRILPVAILSEINRQQTQGTT
jgi:hypothetical protein